MKQSLIINASGCNLPEAWENSLIELYNRGLRVKTEYDRPEDEASIDATASIEVVEPTSEPMLHRDMPGGLEDLQEYMMEVLFGIKDDLVRQNNYEHTWSYTYHERLFTYGNQVEKIVQKLIKNPYTRRAQAITWKVDEDNEIDDPPCLQSVWCRIFNIENKNHLVMNVRMRSNDAYRAAFMNMFAFITLQRYIANRISNEIGEEIYIGPYHHYADSYHIYGSNLNDFRNRFRKMYKDRTFKDRTWNYSDVKPVMTEAIPDICEKVARLTGKYL